MNSRTSKTNDAVLPPALAAAVAEAENVLKRYDAFAGVMAETHGSIPESLATERQLRRDLGLSEVEGGDVQQLRGRLSAVTGAREQNVRRRQSASEALLTMDNELAGARAAIDSARTEFGAELIRQFDERWREACARLTALRAEALALAGALRCEVATPAPFVARTNPISGGPEIRPVASAEPVAAANLPAALVTVGTTLDRLDVARGLVGGIKQTRQLEQHHRGVCRGRGTSPVMAGVFTVLKPVTHLGMTFARGSLVDNSVICDASLQRLLVARFIVSEDGAAAAA